MKIEQLMTRNVGTCSPDEPLSAAARIMWEGDCGCVPVVEQSDGAARVVGMLTDRDICMAAYTQGHPLSEIRVESAMAKNVCSCRMTDSIGTALKVLEQNQIHRLPVLDQNDHLIGVLSLADIAREAQREHVGATKEVSDMQVAEALEAISARRSPRDVAAAA
jgi:CBS-domain-containing membrane protein